MNNILEVNNISKSYRSYSSEIWRILSWFGLKSKTTREIYTLKNINFSIKASEAIGIIGQNGAGKSTLLKIITGTLSPTTGTIKVNGKIAAILELGMGFHPDLTGRQNAYHSAGLMGYTREQIDTVISDIENFADIGEYFDQPVRIYSSGMQARVAFAVATAFKPDILIIDEALSVGDLSFQAKCMLKMEDFRKQGVSLFFVSHSLAQVRQLCTKAIFISKGSIVEIGDVAKICDLYQNSLISQTNDSNQISKNNNKNSNMLKDKMIYANINLRKNSIDSEVGTKELEFIDFEILDKNLNKVNNVVDGLSYLYFRATIKANKDYNSIVPVGLLFSDKTGYPILACNSSYYDKYLPKMKLNEIITIEWGLKIPFMIGEYRIDIGLKDKVLGNGFIDRIFNVDTITVIPSDILTLRNFGGMLYVNADIKIF